MDRIDWTEDYATGVEMIDDQHRHLIDLVNEFTEAAGQGKGWRLLDNMLQSLITYTLEHFSAEEEYLTDLGYPDLHEHVALHRQMARRLERLRIEHQVNRRRITADMRKFLEAWLCRHFLEHDLRYASFVRDEVGQAEIPAVEPAPAAAD